ncbi:hypothetical protein D3790_05720 [Xenorhabdus nematophila]|nr:hypothetical protein D3790_05720 [Xenorhabdus nematophila]
MPIDEKLRISWPISSCVIKINCQEKLVLIFSKIKKAKDGVFFQPFFTIIPLYLMVFSVAV